jgi:flagellar motility protein MotE (MotC chaperone)
MNRVPKIIHQPAELSQHEIDGLSSVDVLQRLQELSSLQGNCNIYLAIARQQSGALLKRLQDSVENVEKLKAMMKNANALIEKLLEFRDTVMDAVNETEEEERVKSFVNPLMG